MKEKFLELIGQIDDIERLFHSIRYSTGGAWEEHFSYYDAIYDVPDFISWISAITLEVQDIVDRTGDVYANETLKVLSKRLTGWDDKNDFSLIKGRLKTMESNIDKYYVTESEQTVLPPKVFISHSSRDYAFVSKIVSLFIDMGLDSSQMFCSSIPGYDIPIGKDIFDYLREQFNSYSLHVIIVHSKNYYDSAVSLNEMGAAWVLRSKCTSFLLPGFNFEDMRGVVDSSTIAIKLDISETEIKDKLNQLYDIFSQEFGLEKKKQIIWEQKRNEFIQFINNR